MTAGSQPGPIPPSSPVIPSQGRPPPRPGRWPTISVPAKALRQSSRRFVTVTFAGCSRCALPQGAEFVGASPLPLPDVLGGLTLPLPPTPVHITLSYEHSGYNEQNLTTRHAAALPDSLFYRRQQYHAAVVIASLCSFESISSVSARIPWAFASHLSLTISTIPNLFASCHQSSVPAVFTELSNGYDMF